MAARSEPDSKRDERLRSARRTAAEKLRTLAGELNDIADDCEGGFPMAAASCRLAHFNLLDAAEVLDPVRDS